MILKDDETIVGVIVVMHTPDVVVGGIGNREKWLLTILL